MKATNRARPLESPNKTVTSLSKAIICAATLGVIPIGAHAVTMDYKAAWGFNNNALDSSGNGFHAVLFGNAAYNSANTVSKWEAELITPTCSAGDAFTVNADASCSNGQFGYLNANAAGDYVEYVINVPVAGTYTVTVGNKTGYNRSIYQLSVDGVNQGPVVDQYSVNPAYPVSSLGTVTIASGGNKAFRFTATGKNASSAAYGIAVDYITLTASSSDRKEGASCVVLDGNGDYASASLVSNATDNVSLGAWVKWNGSTGANQHIVYNGTTTTNGYGLFLNNAQGDKIAILCGAKATLQSQAVLATGQWTHVLAVRRSGTWELYVNGDPAVITNATTVPNTPSGGTYVGASQSGTEGFKGLVDDVTVYAKAISDLEIAEMVAAPTDYKVRWNFNNSGADSSGNGFNAVIYGNAAYNADKKEGMHSLALDGSADYAGASLVTNATDNITMAAWVKWNGTTYANQQIVYNGNTTSSGYGIDLVSGQGNKLAIICGGKATLQSQLVLPTGQWTRVIAVRRSGTWELYVNGAPVAITNNTTVPNTPVGGTYVGADQSAAQGFKGLVDDVVIYERALSVNEITALTDFYAFTAGTVRPSASSDAGGANVGPRIPLTQYNGNITVAAGQVVSGLDIYGEVRFTGPGILRDCKVRGLTSYSGESALIQGPSGGSAAWNLQGGLIEWCSIDGTGRESIHTDGIWGGNYTCRYTEIKATTDGIKGNLVGNATIENNRIHDGYYYAWHNDATGGVQPGYPTSPADHFTHSDAIQLAQNSGWVIRGNYLGGTDVPNNTPWLDPTVPADAAIIAQKASGDDYVNACMMMAPTTNIMGALIEKNWFHGGAARINMDTKPFDLLGGVTFRDNKFIRSTGGFYIYKKANCAAVMSNNVFTDGSGAVPVVTY